MSTKNLQITGPIALKQQRKRVILQKGEVRSAEPPSQKTTAEGQPRSSTPLPHETAGSSVSPFGLSSADPEAAFLHSTPFSGQLREMLTSLSY